MNRRELFEVAGKIGPVGVLLLFLPPSTPLPMPQDRFVERIIADNRRLRDLLTKNGWPEPTTYMGEGVDTRLNVIKKQYAGVQVQTPRGPRFILFQLHAAGKGRSYRMAGIYDRSPNGLPAPSTYGLSAQLQATNISWRAAQPLLSVA